MTLGCFRISPHCPQLTLCSVASNITSHQGSTVPPIHCSFTRGRRIDHSSTSVSSCPQGGSRGPCEEGSGGAPQWGGPVGPRIHLFPFPHPNYLTNTHKKTYDVDGQRSLQRSQSCSPIRQNKQNIVVHSATQNIPGYRTLCQNNHSYSVEEQKSAFLSFLTDSIKAM